MDYSITSVGMGLYSSFLKERIPYFVKDNHEI